MEQLQSLISDVITELRYSNSAAIIGGTLHTWGLNDTLQLELCTNDIGNKNIST